MNGSTVSKVLRNKEKYLYENDASRPPARKVKGKLPDIERALLNWVNNRQKQGLPLTDALIREKFRFFATTVRSSESLPRANSTWLEKFKRKNNLMGATALPSKSQDSSHDNAKTEDQSASHSRLPLSAVSKLEDWLAAHGDNPYPTSEERHDLIEATGLSKKQVNTWFSNARRRRQLDPMAKWLSSSSEDEAASVDDIRRALEASSTDAEASSPRAYPLTRPHGNTRSPASESSVGSAFSQCPEARSAGPVRRGRRKYRTTVYSSCSSAGLGSDQSVRSFGLGLEVRFLYYSSSICG